MISCGDSDARLTDAADALGAAQADAAARPRLPADCRDHTVIRPALGERLDALVLRYAWALRDEHRRTDRCAAWHDEAFGAEAES